MSSTEKQKPKQPKIKDVQKQIVEIMLRRNPRCTVAEVGRNFDSLKRYLMGDTNV